MVFLHKMFSPPFLNAVTVTVCIFYRFWWLFWFFFNSLKIPLIWMKCWWNENSNENPKKNKKICGKWILSKIPATKYWNLYLKWDITDYLTWLLLRSWADVLNCTDHFHCWLANNQEPQESLLDRQTTSRCLDRWGWMADKCSATFIFWGECGWSLLHGLL